MDDDITIRPYKTEDALQILDDPAKIAWAKLNEVAGPGFTWIENGKVLACGGIRTCGIGEIWAAFSPEAKKKKKTLLGKARSKIEDMIESARLWTIVAPVKDITPQQANFLEHIGFKKCTCYIYTRKEK